MRYLLFPAALLTALISCSSGNNRRTSDTGMADSGAGGLSTHDTMPSSGTDTAAKTGETSATPDAILSQMNVANTTEIQLSTLAAKKASSPQVKQIARKLAADHSKNREEARALAQKLNVKLISGQGVAATDSAALPSDLQGKTGRDFDRAFIDYEINDHQSSIEKLQSQVIPSVQDEQLKAYLQKTVAEMQAHLRSLQQVKQQLG